MLDTFAALQTPAESRVLVINQTYPRAHIQPEDLEQALGERVGLIVPYAGDAVLDSIDRGIPMATAYREHPAVQALSAFAGQVAQVKVQAESEPRRGGLGRWVQGVIGSIRR
jgi:Flp pilus assembly CpaE family ATPase